MPSCPPTPKKKTPVSTLCPSSKISPHWNFLRVCITPVHPSTLYKQTSIPTIPSSPVLMLLPLAYTPGTDDHSFFFQYLPPFPRPGLCLSIPNNTPSTFSPSLSNFPCCVVFMEPSSPNCSLKVGIFFWTHYSFYATYPPWVLLCFQISSFDFSLKHQILVVL